MAAPETTNNVTVRKLTSLMSQLWTKIKNALQEKQDDLGISSSGDAGKFLNEKGEWATPAGSGVTGVKGGYESSYRTGNVNITTADLGLGGFFNLSTEQALYFEIGATTNYTTIKFFASMAQTVMEFTVAFSVSGAQEFGTTPAVTMYSCRNSGQTLGSSNYVPAVKYQNGSSNTPAKLWVYFGSGNYKRIRCIPTAQNLGSIAISSVNISSIPSGATLVSSSAYSYLPIVTGGFNQAVGSSTKPVYVNAAGQVVECNIFYA